jgi:hypothetical protein
MVTVTAILDSWTSPTSPDLQALGGESAVYDDADVLFSGPHLAAVITTLLSRWQQLEDPDRAGELIVDGVSKTTRLLELQDSLDAILERPAFLESYGLRLSSALLGRVPQRDSDNRAALAAASLGGALRLELGGWAGQRLAVAAALQAVSESENELFAVPVARLLGIAYEMWRFPELKAAISRLELAPAAAEDARHEKAIASLADALGAETRDALLTGLETAHGLFARAGREDSAVFRIGIEAVTAFATGGSAAVGPLAEDLTARVRKRALGYFGMNPTWTSPRFDAEHEWVRLSWLLAGAQRSGEGIAPETIAAQLFKAYVASRTLNLTMRSSQGRGISALVEPAIESELLHDAEMRRTVLAFLGSSAVAEEDRTAADRLRAALISGKKKSMNWSTRATRS